MFIKMLETTACNVSQPASLTTGEKKSTPLPTAFHRWWSADLVHSPTNGGQRSLCQCCGAGHQRWAASRLDSSTHSGQRSPSLPAAFHQQWAAGWPLSPTEGGHESLPVPCAAPPPTVGLASSTYPLARAPFGETAAEKLMLDSIQGGSEQVEGLGHGFNLVGDSVPDRSPGQHGRSDLSKGGQRNGPVTVDGAGCQGSRVDPSMGTNVRKCGGM